MEKDEQRWVMKFFFLQRKKSKTIHVELTGVLGEAAVRLATVNRWWRRFKQGNFSLDDESRPGRPLSDIGKTVSQFLKKEPFLSARILMKRLAASPHAIKEILTRDPGIRKFTRRSVPHEPSAANKAKRVIEARRLLQALRNDQSQNFSQIMTGDERWFDYNYDLPIMEARSVSRICPIGATVET